MKYEILKKELKNSLPETGEALVKYNVSYPEITQKSNFAKSFNGFYSMFAKRYEDFAKNKLLKEAARYKNLTRDEFVPFGAVMRYICSLNERDIISIVVDASVFCGEGKQETKRLSQNWDVKSGRMLLYEDFFAPSEQKEIITGIKEEAKMRQSSGLSAFDQDYDKKIKKGFSKNDFYLTPKGYGFFYPANFLSQTDAPEVFFLLGYSGSGAFDPYGSVKI